MSYAIMSDQDIAREAANRYPDYHELDTMCVDCMYTCKTGWRCAGLTGKSGRTYNVGPMCPVLWKFHPRNPLREG